MWFRLLHASLVFPEKFHFNSHAHLLKKSFESLRGLVVVHFIVALSTWENEFFACHIFDWKMRGWLLPRQKASFFPARWKTNYFKIYPSNLWVLSRRQQAAFTLYCSRHFLTQNYPIVLPANVFCFSLQLGNWLSVKWMGRHRVTFTSLALKEPLSP